MRTSLITGFLFLAVFFVGQTHAAILQGIDFVSADESTEVIFRIDKKVRYKYDYLPASDTLPTRCYLDLYNTSRNQSIATLLQVDDQRLSTIRTGSYPTKLRVVLDLPKDDVCSVISSATEPFQVQISVTSPAALLAKKLGASPQTEPAERAQLPEKPVAVVEEQAQPGAVPSDETTGTEESDIQLSSFTSAGRDSISAWGWAQGYYAHDTNQQGSEDSELSRLQGRAGVDWNKDLGPESSLKLRGAIDLDRLYYDSDLADEETDLTLHETYLQYNRSNWEMSLGKQRVRWGKSDQLSPIDSINPQDFRQFITIDLEDRALPSWMLRNRWHGESIGFETIIQPWFKKSKIEYFDSNWALYRNLRESIIANPSAPDDLKDYVRDLRVETDKPSKSLDNMSAAARFTWQTEQTDFALSYHYGWETLPTITNFPVKNIDYSGEPDPDLTELLKDAVFTDQKVQAKYKRQQTVGFEWESVLDPVGFRGEIAYIDHVAFLSSDLTSARKPVIHLVSGIDYTSVTDWYFNVQGSWYRIHDYSSEILYFEENTVSLLGEISKPVWQGNLEFSLQYNYTITDQSSYLQPSVTLKYFRNLECETGVNIFSGDDDTLFGSYDRDDQAYIRIKAFF